MRRSLYRLALCLGLAFAASPALADTAPAPRAPVLLISIDGLRPQDITPDTMPHVSALAQAGVRAQGMRPAYPSLTFPNHYTLVTGLRPDTHGIVHNSMYDAQLGPFRLSLREAVADGRWWGGEPVWVTAEKAGLRTATLYWPGSEAEIAGIRPRTWLPFDEHTSAQWLTAAEDARPAFATLYFDKVDHLSHQHGPASPEANAARRDTDAAIGHLLARLRANRLLAQVNIVLVSDHGFAEVPTQNAIAVEDMVPPEQAVAHSIGQVVSFSPRPGFEAAVSQRLLGRHEHYHCWRRDALPAHWHYGSHPRVPSILCQMDEGWDALPAAAVAARKASAGTLRGSHGFDPQLPSMQASFIAHGPAFRAGSRLPVFDNVDVYPLLMHLLGVAPAPHQGSLATFTPVLLPAPQPAGAH